MPGEQTDPWISIIFIPANENEKNPARLTDRVYGLQRENEEILTGLSLQDILNEWQKITNAKIDDLRKQFNTQIDEHKKFLVRELDRDRINLDARFSTANRVFGIN